jgi:hypothetical protein
MRYLRVSPTICFAHEVVAQLENNDVLVGHALLVEPTVGGVVEDLVGLVNIVRVDKVHRDEVTLVNGAEVTHGKRAVLNGGGGDGPPDATIVVVSNSKRKSSIKERVPCERMIMMTTHLRYCTRPCNSC